MCKRNTIKLGVIRDVFKRSAVAVHVDSESNLAGVKIERMDRRITD